MNIFTICFLQNCSKIHSRTHQNAPFKIFFSREHAPEPPSIQVALPRSAWHKALCKQAHFSQINLNPTAPPPPK